MSEQHAEFTRICHIMTAMNDDVLPGKMMSSPALSCKGKVFVFFGKGGMGFRLGPQSDPKTLGIAKPQPLSPFKTKPPLKGWWIVNEDEAALWEQLAAKALEFTRTL